MQASNPGSGHCGPFELSSHSDLQSPLVCPIRHSAMRMGCAGVAKGELGFRPPSPWGLARATAKSTDTPNDEDSTMQHRCLDSLRRGAVDTGETFARGEPACLVRDRNGSGRKTHLA